MPKPEFLNVPNPFPCKTGKPIGIMAFSFIGSENGDIKLKPFIWCENIGGDLTNKRFRDDLTYALTVLILGEGVDFAVGPAISLRKSDFKTEQVKRIFHRGNTIGLYVGSTREWSRLDLKNKINKIFSNANVAAGGSLEASKRDKFEEILEQVKTTLPRPVGNAPKR
ncbi:MAG: hypothetical protein AAB662_04455 [Patescibacteria group bacterium]